MVMNIIRNSRILQFSRSWFPVLKMSTVQEQKIKVGDQTINYVKSGEGPKVVFCLPGALGTIWSDFKPQIEGLDKSKFTIIAWDPPGYGHSRPPDRNFCTTFYEDDAQCAQEFMKMLGIDKYSLLGWSDGGISGIIMASKYPDNVEKLVIWGASSYIIAEEVETFQKLRDVSKWSEKMRAPLVALYTEKGLQDMFDKWCDAVTALYNQNSGDLCSSCLEKIKCPTFILHGDKDPMVASEHPGFLFSNIKMAKQYRFPEGKHNIHLKYSKKFNEMVTDFLLL
ncbi:valacyclovir hydrolase [Leptinotarsa decemlineata]|uniref:valacyclovir hydrolase n=1 Tax=Leptinotarsa decemlineata TaxID=7539 RepID=UPI000C254837|nr:valacyclovir hydrolase-like [Leptinotarsa decemlineata]